MSHSRVRKGFLAAAIGACFALGCVPAIPSDDSAAAREAKVRELLRLGTAALREDAPDALQRAEAYFELALELHENDPRALDGLGSVAFRAGALPRAAWFFEESLRAASGYDRAYEHLALVAAAGGNE